VDLKFYIKWRAPSAWKQRQCPFYNSWVDRNRRSIKRDPQWLSKLCNELSSKSFKTIFENTFPDHECLWEKPFLLPTRVPPLFSSRYSKVAFQPLKPVQPDLKPVQPVSGLFLFHPCSDVSDSQSCQKSRCRFFWENRFNRIFSRLNRFWIRSSLRLSRLVNRDLPGGNRFNRFENRFNWFLPLFSQRLPAFGGSFIYPATLSLLFTFASPTKSWLTKLSTSAFISPPTPAIASPSIAWRILVVRRTRSNTLSFSSRFSYSLCFWARCKLNIVRICYSWNLVFLDG
jgi:hypothetical protein